MEKISLNYVVIGVLMTILLIGNYGVNGYGPNKYGLQEKSKHLTPISDEEIDALYNEFELASRFDDSDESYRYGKPKHYNRNSNPNRNIHVTLERLLLKRQRIDYLIERIQAQIKLEQSQNFRFTFKSE